jgi:hypothetical protein
LNTKKEEDKQHANKIEQGITIVYACMPHNAQALEKSAEEKIALIY